MALFRSASSNDATPPRSSSAGGATQHNIIGTDTTVEGTLRASGNVHVSGSIEGEVHVEGRIVVMPGGTLDGELVSTDAEIAGRVRGEVTVRERLVLKATAVVEGNVRTGKLIIEDGAVFNGRCEMTTGASGPANKNSGKRAASISDDPDGVVTGGDTPPARRLGTPSTPRDGSAKNAA